MKPGELDDALGTLSDAVLGAPPMVAPEGQPAFWRAVQRIVAEAGYTYVRGQVFTRAQPEGITYRIEVEMSDHPDRWVNVRVQANDRYRVDRALAWLAQMLPTRRVVNLRWYGVGGVAPRPWGPFDLPEDVVRIDRGTRHGNPYRIGEFAPGTDGPPLTREQAIALFRVYAIERASREPDWLLPLKGKRLACWDAPLACHGDVLVEMLEERGW